MDLSIVIPFYNEEDSVAPLCEAVASALEPRGQAFEVLLIDDGSTDHTFSEARRVAEKDTRFRVVKLKANFGQTAALYAGFNLARGDIIVSMDGDLQNDARDIEAMVSKIHEGYDVVTGWRENRQDRFLVRKIPSMAANWLVRAVTGVPIRDNGCGLRAYRAQTINRLSLYSEMHRLLPTTLALTGARMTEIKVRHHARRYGSSKYGLSRIYKFILDFTTLKVILTAFRMPLFGFGWIALVFLLLAGAAGVGAVVQAIAEPEASIVVLLGVAVLLGSLGTSLLVLGIICDTVYDTGPIRVEDLLNTEII